MYNNIIPSQSDLPTAKQLRRSTLIALITAIVILITIVLPSEYAIDPTGIGRALGLTEMGEIKTQLAEEAAIDAVAETTEIQIDAQPTVTALPVTEANWRDEMQVVLKPAQGAEVKLTMKEGEKAEFTWMVQGGAVNFDTHGDGGGQSTSYEKGRNVANDEGVLEAAFDGNHGWFWRNRGDADVTVVIRARGHYAEMKRVL